MRAGRAGALAASCAAAGASLALLAGCGEKAEPEPKPGPAPGSSAAATELTVMLDADGPGGERPMREQLDCPARDARDAGGSGQGASGAAAACEQAATLTPGALAPVPPDMACTELYGGPDEAEISGRIDGDELQATLTRANGCEIERFDAALPLLRELFPGYEPGASLGPSPG